jgi:hypothetical protein
VASKKEHNIPVVKCDGVPFRIHGADRNGKESESSGLEGEHCEGRQEVKRKENELK